MISKIIDTIDDDIDFITKKWGVVEVLTDGDTLKIGKYSSGGRWTNVANIDKYGSVTYWRLDGDVSSERLRGEDSDYVEPVYRTTYPMQLRVFVKHGSLDDDNKCSSDGLFYSIMKRINDISYADKSTDALGQIINIDIAGYTADREVIMDEDYGEDSKVPFNYIVLSISVNIELQVNQFCLTDNC